jgi:hypothetical protein
MKMRQHRKRKLALFRSHKAFLWSTQRVMKTIALASLKMSAALEAAYAKSRANQRSEA